MRIEAEQTSAEVGEMIREQVERELRLIIRELQHIGELVVTAARVGEKTQGKDYLSQTGNLRSSIGYLLTYEGRELASGGFERDAGGRTDGHEGQAEGKAFAREVAQEEGDTMGIRLVVVAGMKYASYLRMRGYDVLDSAELIAREMIEELQKDYV